MRTLEQVVSALSVCGKVDSSMCPYFDVKHWECCSCGIQGYSPVKDDAYAYLREYLNYRKANEMKSNSDCVSEAENNALTWQELKELEGKPVWVETKRYGSRWYLVEDNTYEDMIVFTGLFGEIAPYFQEDFGKTWQAYRKERQNVQS